MKVSFRFPRGRYPQGMDPAQRVVTFRPRTIVGVSLILVGIAMALWIVWVSRHVITWVLVSLFLALAINPAVEALQRRGIKHRGTAAGLVFVAGGGGGGPPRFPVASPLLPPGENFLARPPPPPGGPRKR